MSIFFDFHVGPSGRRFRRAVDGDKHDIELFIDSEHTDKLFGTVDIGNLIELSTLSICMINENKEVVGFMALNDYPNVIGVDPADWEMWIRNMFQKFYVARNTLFIHFMCCKDSVIEFFLNEALVSVFQNDVYLLHIVLFVSSQCTQENLLRYQIFKRRNMWKFLARRDDDSERWLHHMYVALRQDHCPKLKIRQAVYDRERNSILRTITGIAAAFLPDQMGLGGPFSRNNTDNNGQNRRMSLHPGRRSHGRPRKRMNSKPSREDGGISRRIEMVGGIFGRLLHSSRLQQRCREEDNDDICDILDKKCPRLKALYGNYYISEILAHHPESKRKVIVAEHLERAVGVMCLSPNINYKKLQNIYEVRPYYGLRKATPLEKEQMRRGNDLLSTFGEPIMTGKYSPFDPPPNLDEMINSDASKDNLSQDTCFGNKGKVKINFKRKASMDRSIRPRYSSSIDQYQMDKILSNNSDDNSDRVVMRQTDSVITNMSTNVLLEEDPFDYDIVNIDVSLLTNIAKTFSADNKSRSKSVHSRASKAISVRKRKHSIYKSKSEKDSDWFLYRGDPNAFMIELFGLHEDVNEKSAFDLLEVAFEIMKDYDYCIIRVPSADTSFPLLQHFCLVPTRPRICCVYSLYIAHRASVLGKLRVREAEFIDIPLIAQLFQNIKGKETLWTIENCILENQRHQAYVFMSGLSIVGIGILEPPEKLSFLRAKFNMDPFHNHKYHQPGSGSKIGFAAVDVVLVYYVFETHFRFFAREMMRLSGSNSLVWMTAYRNKWVAHKANSLVSVMVPLLPRKFDIDFAAFPELIKLSAIAKNIMAFSTWFLDKKLTSVPIVNVSTKIVVLGASRTAMAFLNTLLFGNSSTYLSFTNITLISSNGLPYMRNYNLAVEMMFPKYHNNTDKYLKSVPYTFYVNVVQGTMTEINKVDKYITLTNGSKYHYDMLFLLFGKQYQHPDYLKPLSDKDSNCDHYERLDIPRPTFEPEVTHYDTPDNVFIVNNIGQANKALKYVKTCVNEDFDAKILVYGGTIHAYCCLAALLEMNVPAENIVFIDPFPPEDTNKARVSVFYNANVDETVSQVINNLNIKVYRSYYFQSWNVEGHFVTHVEFISYYQIIRLECATFFYYGKRGVNTEAFFAVNKAGIAYDAGILIDHEFRTKDPCIYAAGPGTAYYRKYYAPTMKQKYFDSYELGEKLGIQIKDYLDPLFSEKYIPAKKHSDQFSTNSLYYLASTNSNSSSSKSSFCFEPSKSLAYEFTLDKLPKLHKPKVKYCKLPGGLQYLEVRSPGKKIPHYYLQSLNYNGYVMETFKSGYFKIHMNNDLIVDGLTCLTPEKYSVENFKNIYGLSSVCLNNVHLRYMTKKLDDFYEFFRSPWAFFLYHDQADELFAMVKELLPKGQSEGDTIKEALRQVCTTPGPSTQNNIQIELRNNFDATPYLESITDYVVEWLSENDVLLPMYLQPSQHTEYDHDTDRNQVFRKKKMSIFGLISKIV